MSVQDPSSDVVAAIQGAASAGVNAPWGDLTEVRVAASADRLCVDFKTTSPPRLGTKLTLFVGNPRGHEPDQEGIQPDLNYKYPGLPDVELFANSATSGEVGNSGGRTSLLTAADIGSFSTFLHSPFQSAAYATYEQRTPGVISPVWLDTAPDGSRRSAYP